MYGHWGGGLSGPAAPPEEGPVLPGAEKRPGAGGGPLCVRALLRRSGRPDGVSVLLLDGLPLAGRLPGRAGLFPITPLSQSVQYIGWTTTLFRGDRLGEWGFYMVLANALIFVPVGFFPNLLWRKPRWWKGLVIGCCASFLVEFLQLFVGRATDIDDLILNTLGAFLGGLAVLLLDKLVPKLTRTFRVEVHYGRKTGDLRPAPGAGAGQL